MLSPLLLLALSQTPLTLKHPSAPLNVLVPALAQATGQKLAVSPEMRWHVVYFRVKDVAPEDALSQLAIATHGRWETGTDGTRWLRRNAAIVARDAEAERKSRREVLGKQLARKTQTPDVNLSMARTIGLDELMRMPNGGRWVFSTMPTRMQRPFPRFDPAWVAALVGQNDRNAQAQEQAFSAMGDEEKQMLEKVPAEFRDRIEKAMRGHIPKKYTQNDVGKVLFVVTRQGVSYNFEVKVLSTEGKLLSSGQSYGWDEAEEALVEGIAAPAKPEPVPPTKPETKPVKITLSEKAQTIMRIAYGRSKKEEQEEIKKGFADPTQGDPWLAVETELFDTLKEPNVILSGVQLMEAGMNPTDVGLANEIKPHQQTAPKGWLVAAPLTAEAPLDRELLGRLIARAQVAPRRLEDRAFLAANNPEEEYSMSYRLASRLYRFSTFSDSMLLRLYGMMSPDQQRNAQRGLAVSSLSPAARNFVQKLAFGANAQFGRYSPPASQANFMADLDFEKMIDQALEEQLRQRDYLDEPTEAMPNGLPGDARIEIAEQTNAAFLPAIKFPQGMEDSDFADMAEGGMPPMTVDGLAAFRAMMDQPMFGASMPFQFTEVSPVRNREVGFSVRATAQVGMSELFSDVIRDPNAKPQKLSELGSAYDQALAKRRESMKKWAGLIESFGSLMRMRETPPPTQY